MAAPMLLMKRVRVVAITALGALLLSGVARVARAAEPEPMPAAAPAPTAPLAKDEARGSSEVSAGDVRPRDDVRGLRVEPYATIVGGLKLDTIIQNPIGQQREGRLGAIALSAFGVRGSYGSLVSFHSELMANGGTSLHGASAWEGQAALQVRRQLVRLTTGPWMVEAGRVIDEASVNFISPHVTDTLLQDTATRDPLLYSGFNLGNGVRGTYEPVKGLRVGLTFTAGNPVSNTASLQVGGSFPPFERFYIQPYQAVKQASNNYPDDTFHMMLLSPSLLYDSDVLDARVSFQGYVVDTNTTRTDDQNIHGYNLRANARLKLADDMVSPFANFSFGRNDTVTATDASKLAADKYTGITFGGGVDFNYAHPWPGRANGVGLQYDRVEYQVGSGNVTNLHYVNVGTTYWLNAYVALGARFAMWLRNDVGVHDEGERSALVTMRLVL